MHAACSSNSRPDVAAVPDASPNAESVVGPAPLRRLSNSEYLNALHDLFPGQHPTLPALPNDTVVAGFDNSANVQEPSDVRIARYETIANLFADGATGDAAAISALVGCDNWSTPELATACAQGFISTAGARVFRRPLTEVENYRFKNRFATWRGALDFEAAVRLTLSALLQSPQFLYRPEPRPMARETSATAVDAVEPYAMASRLSFLLWESMPDDDLLAAAANDALRTESQIRVQGERMLSHARARRVFWSFHRQWLGLDRIFEDEHLVRTPEVDPKWGAASQASALTEAKLFVENTLMTAGSFRDLLTSPRAWVNGEMARIYGVTAPADASVFTEVSLPGTERAGLLTRAAFLASYSHRGATSPPIRGNALQLQLLCWSPMPPPPDVDLTPPVADPGQGPSTNRALFATRTSPAACRGCHTSLNGFGFGLENYSASGAYQTTDHGLPVDAKGAIHYTDVDQTYDGAVALSQILSRSRVVHHCAAERWVRYALARAPIEAELPLVDKLTDGLMASNGNLRTLLLDIATAPTFRMRRVDSQ